MNTELKAASQLHGFGRRLVAEGTVAGQSVLVKCFFGRRSQTALWRELRGLRALLAAGLPAPGERLAYHMPQGGVLVTDWLASARPLDLSRVEEQVTAVELLADLHLPDVLREAARTKRPFLALFLRRSRRCGDQAVGFDHVSQSG